MVEHKKEEEVAIVWFKHDLRMDDHLGLAASAQYHRVIPLFIFDSHFYAGKWSESFLKDQREVNYRRIILLYVNNLFPLVLMHAQG
jgi:deoxyribodipyrimidine photolyase